MQKHQISCQSFGIVTLALNRIFEPDIACEQNGLTD